MVNDIVSLTKKLVSITSTPDNKEELANILDLCLSYLKEYKIERFEHKGVKSVLVYNSKKRPSQFKVILNGHLDIIPGKEHQYTPIIQNNRLYGVGTMDMKASIASFITVFKEVAHRVNYPLALQLVTDEEVGGFNGTKYQIDKGVRGNFIIVGETTNFSIENEAKGIVWVKITAFGKTAHGAYPWKGVNAIWKMNTFLNRLEKRYPLPDRKKWVTTVNVSKIQTTNETFNKIPDNCELWLDIRYIPEETNTIVNTIKGLLPKECKMEIVLKEPAQFVKEDNTHISLLRKIGKRIVKKHISLNQGQGSSDARHFTRVGCDAIEFGPRGAGMGTDSEWVDIKSLETYTQILHEFLMERNSQ